MLQAPFVFDNAKPMDPLISKDVIPFRFPHLILREDWGKYIMHLEPLLWGRH
jgi:hypothetical protein